MIGRSENARSRSVPDAHDQSETSKSRTFFTGLKTSWEEYHRTQTERLSRIAAEAGVLPDQIADVLQEVWLDAAKHHEGFQGEDAEQRLSSWLDTVVRSKSRNALRRLRRPQESLENLTVEPMDHKAKEPAELMAAKERHQRLAAQLEELRKENPLNYRLVWEHVREGRSLQDLSAETGLSVHAVTCRISRTLKRLRYRLWQ